MKIKIENNKKKYYIIAITVLVILLIITTICSIKNVKQTVLIQLQANGKSQMMGYVLKTDNDKIIVIDGGTSDDTQNLINTINGYTGKIDYWFITHPHCDHATCFTDIVNNTDIEIGKIYVTLNDKNWYNQYEPSRYEFASQVIDTLGNDRIKDKVEEVSLNQIIDIDNIHCEILGIKNPEITTNAINNSSMVIKMKTSNKSILFLGDTGVESGKKLLNNHKENLKSDIVQMAHHGQSGVEKEVYEAINPTICLWPTPKWLWDNDNGSGEDSGIWKTKETRQWMQELNITKNIIEMDGNIKIQI